MEDAQPADARPIGIGRVAAVERLVDIALGRELLGTDPSGQAMHLLGQRQHQRDRNLGAGDVGTAPERHELDAARRAGRGIDVARHGAIFLHHDEIGSGGELCRPHRQRFDDQAARLGQVRAHVLGGFDEPHLARKERADALAHARAIAVEIRLVMGEEVRIRGMALGRGRRIEQDADDAQEGIVLDDEDRSFCHRYRIYRGC